MENNQQFRDELSSKLDQFEKYRRKMNRLFISYKAISRLLKFVYYPGLAAAIATALLPFLLPFTLIFIIISGVLFLLDISLYHYAFKAPEVRFRQKFKSEIVAWLIQKLHPTFKYSPTGKVPEKDIISSKVFDSKIDLYEGEDYINGTINGVKLQFGEATLYVDKETFGSFMGGVASDVLDSFFGADDSADEDSPNYVKFFNGLIMHADFMKETAGSLLVVPNKVIGTGLFRKDRFNGRERFKTGDSIFDEHFSCYTTDKLNGNTILSPALRESILKLVKTVRSRVYLSLTNGTLLIAIDWQKDLFEAKLNEGISTAKDLEFIIEQINFFKFLSESMVNETLLWAKA